MGSGSPSWAAPLSASTNGGRNEVGTATTCIFISSRPATTWTSSATMLFFLQQEEAPIPTSIRTTTRRSTGILRAAGTSRRPKNGSQKSPAAAALSRMSRSSILARTTFQARGSSIPSLSSRSFGQGCRYSANSADLWSGSIRDLPTVVFVSQFLLGSEPGGIESRVRNAIDPRVNHVGHIDRSVLHMFGPLSLVKLVHGCAKQV